MFPCRRLYRCPFHAPSRHRKRRGIVGHFSDRRANPSHPPFFGQYHRALRRRCRRNQSVAKRNRSAIGRGIECESAAVARRRRSRQLCQKHSAAEFQGYIESHETDFIKFKISILLNGIEDDPIRKAEAISDIVKSIAVIPSEITRAVYIKECSASFDIDEKILAVEVRKAISGKIEKERANALRKKYEDDAAPTETGTEKNEEQKSAPEPAQPAKNPLKLSETEVIRYIAKYGMCDFCDAIDANGLKYKAVVLEYIYMDLNKDEMSFSVPAYQKIYQKALSLLPEFKTESEKKAVELEQTKKELEREEIERIRTQFDNIDDIRQAEDSMKERIGQRIETELAEFKTDFLERHLCSDPDNDIRKTTLELITEKAQLSKLHTKYAKNRKRLRPPQRVGAPIVAGVERCHTRPANQTYPCENQRFRQFAGRHGKFNEANFRIATTSQPLGKTHGRARHHPVAPAI